MPKIITKTGTPRTCGGAQTYVVGVTRPTASYLYLADGTKVRATDDRGRGYEYLGSLRLNVNGEKADIESIPFAGGRIVKTTNGYEPHYYITDHLGSTRAIVRPAAAGVEIMAEYDYMPYGTQHTVAEAPTADADYKYTGKEQQGAFGMYSLYDSQARFQNVTSGCFLSQDPLSGDFPEFSPYIYCGGDPINRTDPDGRIGFTIIASSVSLYTMIKAAFATAVVSATAYAAYNYKNRDYGQGWRHQGNQDRKQKEALDRARINIQKSIKDNFPDPDNFDPNNQKEPEKDLSTLEMIGIGTLLSARLISEQNVVPTIKFWYDLLTNDNKNEDEKCRINVPDEPMIFRPSDSIEYEDTQKKYSHQMKTI